MSFDQCRCVSEDTLAAQESIRKAGRVAELADESHFMASVRRCHSCGQRFLTLFCGRVDWADGDDPQTRVAVPVSEAEAKQLQTANIATDENMILHIVRGERCFLYHDMPKGAAETVVWMMRRLFIPEHD